MDRISDQPPDLSPEDGGTRMEILKVRISSRTKELLEALAKQEDTTPSAVARKLLAAAVAPSEAEPLPPAMKEVLRQLASVMVLSGAVLREGVATNRQLRLATTQIVMAQVFSRATMSRILPPETDKVVFKQTVEREIDVDLQRLNATAQQQTEDRLQELLKAAQEAHA